MDLTRATTSRRCSSSCGATRGSRRNACSRRSARSSSRWTSSRWRCSRTRTTRRSCARGTARTRGRTTTGARPSPSDRSRTWSSGAATGRCCRTSCSMTRSRRRRGLRLMCLCTAVKPVLSAVGRDSRLTSAASATRPTTSSVVSRMARSSRACPRPPWLCRRRPRRRPPY